jgi:hypothetical protein
MANRIARAVEHTYVFRLKRYQEIGTDGDNQRVVEAVTVIGQYLRVMVMTVACPDANAKKRSILRILRRCSARARQKMIWIVDTKSQPRPALQRQLKLRGARTWNRQCRPAVRPKARID